jgi:hypothetical protein
MRSRSKSENWPMSRFRALSTRFLSLMKFLANSSSPKKSTWWSRIKLSSTKLLSCLTNSTRSGSLRTSSSNKCKSCSSVWNRIGQKRLIITTCTRKRQKQTTIGPTLYRSKIHKSNRSQPGSMSSCCRTPEMISSFGASTKTSRKGKSIPSSIR